MNLFCTKGQFFFVLTHFARFTTFLDAENGTSQYIIYSRSHKPKMKKGNRMMGKLVVTVPKLVGPELLGPQDLLN